MKKTFFPILALAVLSVACAQAPLMQVNPSIYKQDPMSVCKALSAANQKEQASIAAKFPPAVTSQTAALFEELDVQSFSVCRSRISQEMQTENLQELRVEYKNQIEQVLNTK